MRAFRGRVAVVTGAASGIGRALAERFAREGMRVVLADVEQAPLDQVVGALREAGHDVIGIQADVSDPAAVQGLADATLRDFGKVHLLCNNAGVAGGNAAPWSIIWEASLNDWLWATGVNYFGVAYAISIFVPIMLAQDEEGHVVNTSSVAGIVGGQGVYGATKAAVVSMSESLYRDFRRRETKLGVTCLCPTFVNTRMAESDRNRPAQFRDPAGATVVSQPRATLPSGLHPADVADLTLHAIRNNQLYVVTGPEFDEMILERRDAIMGRRNPRILGPSGLRRD